MEYIRQKDFEKDATRETWNWTEIFTTELYIIISKYYKTKTYSISDS